MGVSLLLHPSLFSPLLALCVGFANKLTLQRTVTNVVPSSMTLVLHVLRDISLLVGVRKCITETVGQGATAKFDLRKLEKQPLLLSLYAETLRFGVQIHIPRCSPHRELKIGNMLIPKNKLVLVNTWLAHTDDALWNTKNGAFPLDDFWARRFLVDPKDPSSGPTKKSCASEKTEKKIENDEGLHFSTEGLEGAWIPYGGKIFVGLKIGILSMTCRRWTSCLSWPSTCETYHASLLRYDNINV